MAIDNLQQLIDLIQAGTPAKRRDFATEIRAVESQLSNFDIGEAQAASDARRVVALAFIASDVTPLLTDPTTGDYAAQHAQRLNNIEIVKGFIDTAVDAETRQELVLVREAEREKLRVLKRLHASGGIT